MDIEVVELGGAAVVRISGRVDMVTAPALRSEFARLVASGQARLVADLAGVDFVDSSGLGALISGLKLAREAGGDLRLAAAGAQVRSVLALTTLDRVLRPHVTVDEAVASL